MSLREIDRAFSNVNGAFTDAVGMCAHIIMIIISRFSIGGCVFYAASYLGILRSMLNGLSFSFIFFHSRLSFLFWFKLPIHLAGYLALSHKGVPVGQHQKR